METLTKPDWLRVKVPSNVPDIGLRKRIREKSLCTVCVEAQCPNQMECFHKGTATFMLLGPSCTRRCTFCAVDKSPVPPADPEEPNRIAQAISMMNINYCVITMVTRDDLSDGGADHIRKCIRAIRDTKPRIMLELLISDLAGKRESLETVLATKPNVLNHNIETVSRLYAQVRPQADYDRSLELIRNVVQIDPTITTKSGMMLGLGETQDEVLRTMDDLLTAGCQILTLGQYLAPSKHHYPVQRYVHPDEFVSYKEEALKRGFQGVASSPLVRSSYNAEELYHQTLATAEMVR